MTSDPPAPPAGHATRVMVVDDEALVRLDVAEYLRSCGLEVLEASSADEAVRRLAEGVHVEVLFTDVEMPGELNGFGLARWLRRNRPQTRVMMTSGHAGMARRAQTLCEEGGFLPKPLEHDRLRRRILQARRGGRRH